MEKLFLPAHPTALCFKIYTILPENYRKLIKTIPIEEEQLGSIDSKGGLYHTHCGGYELVWEASHFEEGADTNSEETDRDYSEFLSIRMDSNSTNSE